MQLSLNGESGGPGWDKVAGHLQESGEGDAGQRIAELSAEVHSLKCSYEKELRRQSRVMRLVEAVNAGVDLKSVLRLVRDTFAEAFDRVGVFLYDEESRIMRGAWGTDREGNPEDIYDQWYPVSDIAVERMARADDTQLRQVEN